jgi:cytochrome c553
MIRFSSGRLLVAAALTALAGATFAQNKPVVAADPAQGQAKSAVICAACHGADGNSVLPANPILAGQFQQYLLKQLVDYSKPIDDPTARVNAVMNGIAATLTPEDKANLSAWFASQKPKPNTALNKDTLALGRKIYRAGLPDKGVPACAGCHNPNGAGVPIQYPRLAGQWGEYAEAQLKAFRDGTRRNSLQMTQIAPRLSDAEMKAVADYMAGLQ